MLFSNRNDCPVFRRGSRFFRRDVFIHCYDRLPLLNFIFQKFMIDDFTFNLVRTDRKEDKFHYIVSYEDFKMLVCITGIDTAEQCGPFSNIDIVHFVWENFLRFSYKNLQWRSHLAARLSYQIVVFQIL